MPNAPYPSVRDAADALADIGRRFHARGWVLGTSGNFSVVTSHEPMRLSITASSVDKGSLDASQIIDIDDGCGVHGGYGGGGTVKHGSPSSLNASLRAR